MTRTSKMSLAVVAIVTLLAVGRARAADREPPSEPIPDDRLLQEQPYDPQYLFVVTREMRDSSGDPAAVVCLAPLTLVVDVFLLPVEALLGFLG